MQFQLSVFYVDHYLSYSITTEDKVVFHFTLRSAPPGDDSLPPDAFIVTHKGEAWQFDKDLDAGFKKSVISTLKKAKL